MSENLDIKEMLAGEDDAEKRLDKWLANLAIV